MVLLYHVIWETTLLKRHATRWVGATYDTSESCQV